MNRTDSKSPIRLARILTNSVGEGGRNWALRGLTEDGVWWIRLEINSRFGSYSVCPLSTPAPTWPPLENEAARRRIDDGSVDVGIVIRVEARMVGRPHPRRALAPHRQAIGSMSNCGCDKEENPSRECRLSAAEGLKGIRLVRGENRDFGPAVRPCAHVPGVSPC
jgi:hypothetical protein